jgi:hypothetical protein
MRATAPEIRRSPIVKQQQDFVKKNLSRHAAITQRKKMMKM